MIENWIKQRESSILDLSPGSTVLIRFFDGGDGITADDGSTVDISWKRTGEEIHATTGNYNVDDIYAWILI